MKISNKVKSEPQKAYISRMHTQLDIMGIWYFGKISKIKTIFPSLFPCGRGFREVICQKKCKLKYSNYSIIYMDYGQMLPLYDTEPVRIW